MTRTTWVLAALLAASLVWAYAASRQPAPTGGEQLVPVWKITTAEVRRIEYRTGETRVSLTMDSKAAGGAPYWWVEGEAPASAPRERGGKSKAEPKPDAKPAPDAFKGNALAQRFVDDAASLEALRVIGPAGTLKLTDYGLSGDGSAFLRIERQGSAPPVNLELGAMGPGNATRYALSSLDNRVYLLRQSSFRVLGNFRRFMDRELLPFPAPEAARLEFKLGERALTVHRLDVPVTEVNRWGRTPQDEEGEAGLQELVNALSRIKVSRFAAEAAPASAKPEWSVTAVKSGVPPVEVKFMSSQGADVTAASAYTGRDVVVSAALVKSLRTALDAALAKR